MQFHRAFATGYFVILVIVATLNYWPFEWMKDEAGNLFGIFALDIYDDSLHLASGLWAGIAALVSARAARIFLILFGALYLADGAFGLVTGVGYLDLAIFTTGPVSMPFGFKILANLPHIGLGAVALWAGLQNSGSRRVS